MRISDWSACVCSSDLAARLKAAPYDARPYEGPQSVAMIFDKPTLRTQVSFAAGIAELGGNPMLVAGTLAGIGVRASADRSDERRVGQECVRTSRARWSAKH